MSNQSFYEYLGAEAMSLYPSLSSRPYIFCAPSSACPMNLSGLGGGDKDVLLRDTFFQHFNAESAPVMIIHTDHSILQKKDSLRATQFSGYKCKYLRQQFYNNII